MRHDGIEGAKAIDLTRCYEASDRQIGVSRRTQALLAAAGMDRPSRWWFVMRVKNGADGAVERALLACGVEAWKPVVMVPKRRRGGMPKGAKPDMVPKLAMAGLLFVHVEATDEAMAGLATVEGFAGMLEGNGRPIPVRDADVALFRAYLGDDPQAKATVASLPKPGEQVLVRGGPFHMFQALLTEIDDIRGRAIVELLILGSVKPINLEIAQIAKL